MAIEFQMMESQNIVSFQLVIIICQQDSGSMDRHLSGPCPQRSFLVQLWSVNPLKGPHQLFDYTFLTRSPCCNPGGGSFENGNNTEPFDHFAIQRPFPEGAPESYKIKIPNKQGTKMVEKERRPAGYVGQPVFKKRVEGPVFVGNYPPSILVQKRSQVQIGRSFEIFVTVWYSQ